MKISRIVGSTYDGVESVVAPSKVDVVERARLDLLRRGG